MAQATYLTRDEEIQEIWKDNRWLYVLAGVLLGLLITPAIEQITGSLNELIGNLVPEAVGILFTVLIVDRLAENRATEQLKKRLIREAGSQSNETAKSAVDWMRYEGWLTVNDEIQLLKDADLQYAKLQTADLRDSQLERVDLQHANLQSATLWNAYLSAADLRYANLQVAILSASHLQSADLRFANLRNADLYQADLRGANLYHAKLEGAKIEKADFNEKTVLPDSQYLQLDDEGNFVYDKYWTPETDMSCYTNPDHPDFWQPQWVKEEKST